MKTENTKCMLIEQIHHWQQFQWVSLSFYCRASLCCSTGLSYMTQRGTVCLLWLATCQGSKVSSHKLSWNRGQCQGNKRRRILKHVEAFVVRRPQLLYIWHQAPSKRRNSVHQGSVRLTAAVLIVVAQFIGYLCSKCDEVSTQGQAVHSEEEAPFRLSHNKTIRQS